MNAPFDVELVATTPTSVVVEVRNGQPYRSATAHVVRLDGRELRPDEFRVDAVRGHLV